MEEGRLDGSLLDGSLRGWWLVGPGGLTDSSLYSLLG